METNVDNCLDIFKIESFTNETMKECMNQKLFLFRWFHVDNKYIIVDVNMNIYDFT